MKKLIAASALSLAIMAGGAHSANILTVVGGDVASLTSSFDPIPASPDNAFTGQVSTANAAGQGLKLDATADIKFTYLGSEAGFTNFFLSGAEVFEAADANFGNVYSRNGVSADAGGFLPFFFTSNDGSSTVTIVNGAGAISGASIAFKVLEDTLDFVKVIAFLNDAGADTDYDDMVVSIEARRAVPTEGDVPLPGAVILLMSGLAGLGYMGRQRKAKSA